MRIGPSRFREPVIDFPAQCSSRSDSRAVQGGLELVLQPWPICQRGLFQHFNVNQRIWAHHFGAAENFTPVRKWGALRGTPAVATRNASLLKEASTADESIEESYCSCQ
jgi:hypothetical protein